MSVVIDNIKFSNIQAIATFSLVFSGFFTAFFFFSQLSTVFHDLSFPVFLMLWLIAIRLRKGKGV
jgi:hypothetical protein